MNLRSDSFAPYDRMDPRLAFGVADPDKRIRLAGNRNPHLAWSRAPEGTQSFALLCVDSDAPSVGTDVNREGVTAPVYLKRADFFHWVLVDLSPTTHVIVEGAHSDGVTPRGKAGGPSPAGGIMGLNDYTGWFAEDPDMKGHYFGYDGPCPPWNDERVHGYTFRVYALDRPTLGLSGRFTGPQVLQSIKGHVLASASLVGLYSIYHQ